VSDYLIECIRMRLKIGVSDSTKLFDHIDAYYSPMTNGVVFVFVVNNGQAQVLEDGWDLFPSDTLITKLRLLQK